MNNQIPFFMPMYPNNQIERINILERRIRELEERITNLENTKLIKLQNNKSNYDNFKEGYML